MNACLVVALASCAPSLARAQEDPLARAEQAYVDVNFADALVFAQQALESGAYGPAELARIYRLIGVAAAAEGDTERAIDACERMFALDPDAQIDEDLSPRLRQPFMDALGRWTARRATFEAGARRLRGSRGIAVTLSDPLSMGARMVAFTRIGGAAGELSPTELPAGAEHVIPIEGLTDEDAVELYVRVLDAHGNRLIELGSAIEPRVFRGESASEIAEVVAPSPATPPPASGGVTPWLFGVGVALTLASGAVLAWSIVDVLDSHSDYLSAPTLEKYYYGLDLQTRTNILIGTTAALGLATVVLAIFTDWGGSPAESALAFDVLASPELTGASLRGRF
jgi:hypothetical protein